MIAASGEPLPTTHFYSIDERKDLLAELDEIDCGASPEHLALVGELYGP